MGKSSSMWGKTSGKIGGLVYSTSGGETIVREYNPNVSNPSTPDQVNQRARMKLMSQLSAAVAPSLAMSKDGLVSARNKFTKRNFTACYASGGVAQITYENIQLTEGSLGLPQIRIVAEEMQSGRVLGAAFTIPPSQNINRIVYNVYCKSQEGQLSFVASQIVTTREATTMGYFQAAFTDMPSGDLVVYAYGMVDTSEQATANYGNLNVQDGTDIARLVASRKINFADYQFTQTRGATVGANNQPVTPTPAGSARVFVTALGNGGSVSGGGTFTLGEQVTVVATPASGYEFVRWIYNGTELTASTNATYTFTLESQVDLVAVFESNQGGGGL